ncbi:MAG: cohesin domain-containing protein [Acutalibacteraceae bacterium]
MKRLCSLFISLTIVLLAIFPVLAADYGCSLTLDSKVQTGKGFTVQLNVFGGGDVAASLFTVCYDPSVMELKSASLSDGTDGKLEYSISEGTASLVFLNEKGEKLTQDEKGIISLRFNALSTPCNAFITLYGEQAVSHDESYLPCGYGVEYPIELAERVSGSVSRSGGTKVESSPSSGSSKSSSKNSSSESSRASDISGQEHLSASASYSNGTVTSLGSSENPQSPFIYIMFGVIITLCVVCAALVIYRAGKRRGELQQAQKSDGSSADKAVKNTTDAACLDEIFSQDNADLFDYDEE